jgi:hypothetical protein
MMRLRLALCLFGALLCWPGVAWAGMPRATAVLNELPRLRLQSISFFLAGFLLSSLLIQWLWNLLARDFSFLPRLSYLRAVGLVTLWGLLFILVLTMISGARELMTPGAWEPSGMTYRLAHKAGPAPPDDAIEKVRREQLERLKEALWQYARAHEGRFPSSQSDAAIPKELWQLPGTYGMQYVYLGGTATAFDGLPLACEPEVYGLNRWVLFTDGTIRLLSSEEIRRALVGGKR